MIDKVIEKEYKKNIVSNRLNKMEKLFEGIIAKANGIENLPKDLQHEFSQQIIKNAEEMKKEFYILNQKSPVKSFLAELALIFLLIFLFLFLLNFFLSKNFIF